MERKLWKSTKVGFPLAAKRKLKKNLLKKGIQRSESTDVSQSNKYKPPTFTLSSFKKKKVRKLEAGNRKPSQFFLSSFKKTNRERNTEIAKLLTNAESAAETFVFLTLFSLSLANKACDAALDITTF